MGQNAFLSPTSRPDQTIRLAKPMNLGHHEGGTDMKHYGKLGLLDVLLALPSDPAGMMRHLLRERKTPPFIGWLPLLLVLILASPPLYYQHSLGMNLMERTVVASIAFTTIVTFLAFNLFTTVLFKVLAINVTPIKIFANTLYALTPLIPFMLGFYLADYIVSGELALLRYMASGIISYDDWLTPLFPTAMKLTLCICLAVFAYGIKALGTTTTLSAFALMLLCLPILVGAFLVAVTLANSLFPDTGIEVFRFFRSFVSASGR